MAITSLMVKGLAISPEAIQRNVDEWERRGRSWQGVDRFEMTEQQMISVVEKLYDTDYFSSTYLMSPSIPEFAVLIQEPDDYVNTYVCFRRTLLKEGDILTDDQDGLQRTRTNNRPHSTPLKCRMPRFYCLCLIRSKCHLRLLSS